MKTLTLIAVAAMPMTLVASVFGMNVTHIPFANEPAGFWLIIGIMVIAALVLYIFFRIKRWF